MQSLVCTMQGSTNRSFKIGWERRGAQRHRVDVQWKRGKRGKKTKKKGKEKHTNV